VSGWQVAADANLSAQTYPDQSLYPSNSVPGLVKRLSNALVRADQIDAVEGNRKTDWYVPMVADAEAGFGGPLHAFELMKAMIEAGFHHLHGLRARHRAEGAHIRLLVERAPEPLGSAPRETVLDAHRGAEPHDFLGLVIAAHAFPARILAPRLLERLGIGPVAVIRVFRVRHRDSPHCKYR
jgi:hypothetical protein